MNYCKNSCRKFEKGDNSRVYAENGCFCRKCDYYFKELFTRCPCCNTLICLIGISFNLYEMVGLYLASVYLY